MTLEQVYFVSQVIAAAAVVGSLIFVGLQMRRQAIETRIATNSRLLEEYRQYLMETVRNPAMSDSYEKGFHGGFEAVDREYRQRFALMLSSGLRILEQAFVLHQSGRLDPRAWAAMEIALSPAVLSRAGRQYWAVRKNAFYGPFKEYMDLAQQREGLVDNFHEFLDDPVAALERAGPEPLPSTKATDATDQTTGDVTE